MTGGRMGSHIFHVERLDVGGGFCFLACWWRGLCGFIFLAYRYGCGLSLAAGEISANKRAERLHHPSVKVYLSLQASYCFFRVLDTLSQFLALLAQMSAAFLQLIDILALFVAVRLYVIDELLVDVLQFFCGAVFGRVCFSILFPFVGPEIDDIPYQLPTPY